MIVSTTTFPNASAYVNGNVANYQWCITHVAVSSFNLPTTFTMAYSTAPFTQPLTSGTTDYRVFTASGTYEFVWPYRTPYCAPVGQKVLTITSSVATAILTVEGYLFRGWNQ